MARTHKVESRLFERTNFKRENRILRLALRVEGLLGLALLSLGIFRYFLYGETALIVIVAIIGFVFVGHILTIRHNQNEINKKASGARAEDLTARKLADQLPDDYALINDCTLTLGRKHAQFDHIVIGPNGVFVVETKNWCGQITDMGRKGYWTIRQEKRRDRLIRNPLKQTQRQVKVMQAALLETPWVDAPIHGIIHKSNPYAEWRVDTADIHLLYLPELIEFIRETEVENRLSPYDIEDIALHLTCLHDAGKPPDKRKHKST